MTLKTLMMAAAVDSGNSLRPEVDQPYYTVPAGYRLAITQVNLQVVQAPPPGADPPWLALHGAPNGEWVLHAFPATRAAGRWMGTTNTFFVVEDVPSGGSFVLGAAANSYVVISGYLVRM